MMSERPGQYRIRNWQQVKGYKAPGKKLAPAGIRRVIGYDSDNGEM